MLRDLCPERRREVFLLVSAVREHVVSEMLVSVDVLPDEILVSRGARRLQDSLGLSEDSARWAVGSWLPVSRVMAALPEIPLPVETPAIEVEDPVDVPAGTPVFDWRWLACGVGAILCAAFGVGSVAWFALHHSATTLKGWSIETGLLAACLAVAAGGLTGIAAVLGRRRAPNHRGLSPNRAAAAMLVDIAALLALPLFVAGAPAVWVLEWVFELHITGQPHDLTFQLGRILQSLVLAAALWVWARAAIRIQGRIASSLIQLR
jgi:hypothetical protein